jgi:hypothetical protein
MPYRLNAVPKIETTSYLDEVMQLALNCAPADHGMLDVSVEPETYLGLVEELRGLGSPVYEDPLIVYTYFGAFSISSM